MRAAAPSVASESMSGQQVGRVLAVSRSPRHGFSKQPQPGIVLIAGEGVEGDAHRGITVQHLYDIRRGPQRPNLSQVHLFPAEMLREVAAKGFLVSPGDLGENILTDGLDLLALPAGTVLRLGPEAVVEVTGLRTPCVRIDRHRSGLQALFWGERDTTGKRARRAGVMSVIRNGGEVRPGDSVWVELPPEPHRPLGPL